MNLPIAFKVHELESDLDPDLALRLTDVSVCYRIPTERIRSLKEYAIRLVQGRIGRKAFWGLQNVNLQVRKGEVLGIIGRNGAGKSTLLKVVARVLRPTTGRVQVRGRVAPLLEFQAGFHPELTGAENIFLNGTLLGFTRREMQDKFDRIVDFAALDNFMDAPLRTFSSGMVARLGFSIATDSQPDILIVDEVLSVGDDRFQRKSRARMEEFRCNGATVLFVTHNMQTMQEICTRAIWLQRGQIVASGSPADIAAAYLEDKDNVVESEKRSLTLQRKVGRPAFRSR